MIENQLNIQEIRLLTVYLACINPQDINTKTVIFRLADFQRLFNFKHLWESEIKQTFKRLLSHTLFISNNGEFNAFQLFKNIRLYTKDGEKIIEITAHDEAVPYLFNIQGQYFSYPLWNIFQLKSVNQFRLYELLKQYEKKGTRELEINELKELLGINPEKYSDIDNFKRKVLDVCMTALQAHTDIKATYRTGKRSKCNKTESIIFDIEKNTPGTALDKILKNDIIESLATVPELPREGLEPHPEGTTPRAAADTVRGSCTGAALDDLTAAATATGESSLHSSSHTQSSTDTVRGSCTGAALDELTAATATSENRRTNSDIETILDLYPEFTTDEINAIYNRIIPLQQSKGIYGTARIDYFITVYDDMKLHESNGNKIYNHAAYMKKMLDNRISML